MLVEWQREEENLQVKTDECDDSKNCVDESEKCANCEEVDFLADGKLSLVQHCLAVGVERCFLPDSARLLLQIFTLLPHEDNHDDGVEGHTRSASNEEVLNHGDGI